MSSVSAIFGAFFLIFLSVNSSVPLPFFKNILCFATAFNRGHISVCRGIDMNKGNTKIIWHILLVIAVFQRFLTRSKSSRS